MAAIKLKKGISLRQQTTQKAQEAKLRGAAKMYEKQFLREMVKAMRSTVSHSEFSKPGFAQKIYKNQLDEQYAEKWGDSSSFGLADVIYKQIKERYFPNKKVKGFKGPIPIKTPRQFLKNEKSNKSFPVESTPGKSPKDLSYIIKPHSNRIEDRNVSSIFDGIVTQSYNSAGKNVVEIDHSDGLLSKLAFVGPLKSSLSMGQEVKAGESVGEMSSVDNPLYLKVWQT